MKRIHGILLIITGVVHTVGSFIPGIFGDVLFKFAKKGFFNISKGLLAFPLFKGELVYPDFAAFWFLYMGPIVIFIGIVFDYIEKREGHIPFNVIVSFLILSLIGAYMIPLSGMTFLLLPQSIYMLIRTKKLSADKMGNVSSELEN